MMKIVISQSMYFPWVGFLEQIRLADVLVHYDDVQFSKGSFSNRVQVKTANGSRWLTLPLRDLRLGQRIDETLIDDRKNWRHQQRELLRQAYSGAPFCDDMLRLVDEVFAIRGNRLVDVTRASLRVLAEYFDLTDTCQFKDSTQIAAGGSSSQRVHDIVKAVGGTHYITGHGARHYLGHDMFEASGIAVEYMNYILTPYQQQHGAFTPYVTALDLVANCGPAGRQFIHSASIPWKEFIHGSH